LAERFHFLIVLICRVQDVLSVSDEPEEAVRPTSGEMAQECEVVDESPLGVSQVANTQGSQLTEERPSL
jgi:hypothetical protein